ncbi:MAG: glutathione S-transferase [Defluviicoccus sp.]|nr:glutathione S-transferase [Defluviicoccus sp.]MDE0385371.1 glutathione S-transferase [Defluviicoccus sp.]
MKLYVWSIAPNPRRVRIYLIEKGIEVPQEEVGVPGKPILDPAFLERAPHRRVPLLELDDGTLISEAMAICRYFEALNPDPPLMGADALEKARVEMWERMSEFEGLLAVAESFRNAKRSFAGRALPGIPGEMAQIPELVERGRQRAALYFDKLDGRLADARYLAGERFTVADITAYCTVDFARFIEMEVSDERPNLARWHAEVAARESIRAT